MLNPLQIDPLKLVGVRRAFMIDALKRLRGLYDDLLGIIHEEFGQTMILNAPGDSSLLDRLVQKAKEFAEKRLGGTWAAKYIAMAFRKGAQQSYQDVNKKDGAQELHEFQKAVNVNTVEGSSQGRSTLGKLFTKVKEIFSGIAQTIVGGVTRVIAKVLGKKPKASQVAKEVKEEVKKPEDRVRTTVETEVVESYSEGQLDMLEHLGIRDVDVEDEILFTTAGDKKVCKRCRALAAKNPYTTTTARGLIPVHPRCRCKWKPSAGSGAQSTKPKGGLANFATLHLPAANTA